PHRPPQPGCVRCPSCSAHVGPGPHRARCLLRGGCSAGSWEVSEGEVEARALRWLAFGPDAAPVSFHDPLDGCEADAGTFELVAVVEPLEDTKELVLVGHVEACTVVDHM